MGFSSDPLPSTPEELKKLGELDPAYAANPLTFTSMRDMDVHLVRSMMASSTPDILASCPPTVTRTSTAIPTRSSHTLEAWAWAPSPSSAHKEKTCLPVVLLFHGGGYQVGQPLMEASLAQALVEEHGVVAVSVGYRFSPEHKYPAALQDAWDAMVFLSKVEGAKKMDARADPSKGFVVGGTSAGATLAMGIAYAARHPGAHASFEDVRGEEVEREPSGLLLTMPTSVDQAHIADDIKQLYLSRRDCRLSDLLTSDDLEFINECYAPGQSAASFPLSYLPKGTRGDLPPTVVLVAGWDPARDDGLMLARVIAEGGRKGEDGVRVKCYNGVPHGFMAMCPQLEKSKQWKEDAVAGCGWLLERSS